MEKQEQERIINSFMDLDAQSPGGHYSNQSRDMQNRLAINNVRMKDLQKENIDIYEKFDTILKKQGR